jgi:predicted dehydrogenase
MPDRSRGCGLGTAQQPYVLSKENDDRREPVLGVPLNIGVIGVGMISEQYFAAFSKLPGIRLVAVADLDGSRGSSRAQEVANALGVRAVSLDELLDDRCIAAVVNLTIPSAHVEVGMRALRAGKHV